MNERTRQALIVLLYELKYDALDKRIIGGSTPNTLVDACEEAISALVSDETIIEVT